RINLTGCSLGHGSVPAALRKQHQRYPLIANARRPIERHSIASPLRQRFAMGCDSRFQVRRPALALPEAPKRNTEVFLGHGPEKRRPLAGKFFQCFTIGCELLPAWLCRLALPEHVKRSAQIALGGG